jgi:hypothetical protein
MEIKAHLTEEELEQAWFEPGRGVAAHLENCEICRTELIRLRHAMQRQAVAGNEFWEVQRQRIWNRIEVSRNTPKTTNWSWSYAFAALIVLATMLFMNSGNRPSEHQPEQAQVDPDHELLLEVDRIIQSDGPMALQPAGLMTETQPNQDSAISNKESTHAN